MTEAEVVVVINGEVTSQFLGDVKKYKKSLLGIVGVLSDGREVVYKLGRWEYYPPGGESE